MTTWSEIGANVISCQVKVCAEGDEDCAAVLHSHTAEMQLIVSDIL